MLKVKPSTQYHLVMYHIFFDGMVVLRRCATDENELKKFTSLAQTIRLKNACLILYGFGSDDVTFLKSVIPLPSGDFPSPTDQR